MLKWVFHYCLKLLVSLVIRFTLLSKCRVMIIQLMQKLFCFCSTILCNKAKNLLLSECIFLDYPVSSVGVFLIYIFHIWWTDIVLHSFHSSWELARIMIHVLDRWYSSLSSPWIWYSLMLRWTYVLLSHCSKLYAELVLVQSLALMNSNLLLKVASSHSLILPRVINYSHFWLMWDPMDFL